MAEDPKYSPQEVAEHLARVFYDKGRLYQDVAVRIIRTEFDDSFIYSNENGNPAIHRSVLKEFRKLTPDAVWSRSDFCWEKRRAGDPDGRSTD